MHEKSERQSTMMSFIDKIETYQPMNYDCHTNRENKKSSKV